GIPLSETALPRALRGWVEQAAPIHPPLHPRFARRAATPGTAHVNHPAPIQNGWASMTAAGRLLLRNLQNFHPPTQSIGLRVPTFREPRESQLRNSLRQFSSKVVLPITQVARHVFPNWRGKDDRQNTFPSTR